MAQAVHAGKGLEGMGGTTEAACDEDGAEVDTEVGSAMRNIEGARNSAVGEGSQEDRLVVDVDAEGERTPASCTSLASNLVFAPQRKQGPSSIDWTSRRMTPTVEVENHGLARSRLRVRRREVIDERPEVGARTLDPAAAGGYMSPWSG